MVKPALPVHPDTSFSHRARRANSHYLDEGAGDPVVMLHGNPTWSFYYRNLVLALRDNYRCIVPDHIGCGLSDKPPRIALRLLAEVARSTTSKRCSTT